MRAAPLACQSQMSHIQLEKKRGSRNPDREREKEAERDDGGGGESRGHVNRYMLETHWIFIHAVMHWEMGEVTGRGMWSLTAPEC